MYGTFSANVEHITLYTTHVLYLAEVLSINSYLLSLSAIVTRRSLLVHVHPLDSAYAALPDVSSSYLFITLDKDYLAHVQPLDSLYSALPVVSGFTFLSLLIRIT